MVLGSAPYAVGMYTVLITPYKVPMGRNLLSGSWETNRTCLSCNQDVHIQGSEFTNTATSMI